VHGLCHASGWVMSHFTQMNEVMQIRMSHVTHMTHTYEHTGCGGGGYLHWTGTSLKRPSPFKRDLYYLKRDLPHLNRDLYYPKRDQYHLKRELFYLNEDLYSHKRALPNLKSHMSHIWLTHIKRAISLLDWRFTEKFPFTHTHTHHTHTPRIDLRKEAIQKATLREFLWFCRKFISRETFCSQDTRSFEFFSKRQVFFWKKSFRNELN